MQPKTRRARHADSQATATHTVSAVQTPCKLPNRSHHKNTDCILLGSAQGPCCRPALDHTKNKAAATAAAVSHVRHPKAVAASAHITAITQPLQTNATKACNASAKLLHCNSSLLAANSCSLTEPQPQPHRQREVLRLAFTAAAPARRAAQMRRHQPACCQQRPLEALSLCQRPMCPIKW